LEDGRIVAFHLGDGPCIREGEVLDRDAVLGLFSIGAAGVPTAVAERVHIMEEGMGYCVFDPELAEAVNGIVAEVIGSRRCRRGREVYAPLWLIDLSLRLLRGERPLLVEPGEQWRPVAEMLSRRDVQAIVVTPADETDTLSVRGRGIAVVRPD
jgi:hypothetical protein